MPTGYVLAPGWRVSPRGTRYNCTHAYSGDAKSWCMKVPAEFDQCPGAQAACLEHAEAAGAVVRAPEAQPDAPSCWLCHDTDDVYRTSDGRHWCVGCRCKRCGGAPPDGNTCMCDYQRRAPVTPAAVKGDVEREIEEQLGIARQCIGTQGEDPTDRVIIALAEKNADLRAQLATRDARIAELEASSADLVRRAQEAEERLASTDRAHEALTERFNAACDDAAELRGKLAAAERKFEASQALAEEYGLAAVVARRERDEATAKERARCLAAVREPETCYRCNGTGERPDERSAMGTIRCPVCNGAKVTVPSGHCVEARILAGAPAPEVG